MFRKIKFLYLFLIISLTSSLQSQSLQEMQKLKQEYEDVKKGIQNPGSIIDEKQNLEVNTAPRIVNILPSDYQLTQDSLKKAPLYFGYDFFNLRDSLKFWENIPPPNNYILGPGDEIVVYLWGETQISKTYTINRDGKVYDDKIGVLSLTGKTTEECKLYLSGQFGKIYSTLNGEKPTTFLDISLGQLKTINVNIAGKVKYPGVYPLHPYSNLITSLIMAGGVDTSGTLREIQIIREKLKPIKIDLYDYLINGKKPENIQLRDQDLVFVPTRLSIVKIDSAVYQPGFYEIKSSETLGDLIDYAGGLKPSASSKISVSRIKPIEERRDSLSNLFSFYVDYLDSRNEKIINGDRLIVHSILNTQNWVEVIGQVKRPGMYSYFQGMSLKDLIDLGGGFEDTTFWKSVYQEKAEIIRRNPKNRYETSLNLNLRDLIQKDMVSSIKLQNFDRLVVHANLNFFERENISIAGEVNIPGSYPLLYDDETLSSILYRAGNLTSKALPGGISIFRKDINRIGFIKNNNTENQKRVRVAWKNESITIMPGDSIIVKESTNTVNVEGEIFNPGIIEFKEGKSIKYYINTAGGITENGNKNKIIIIYANGNVSPNRWLFSPKVKDGSTIVVNEKIASEPFDLTQFATNWTAIISSLLTAALISQQIQN